MSDLNHNESWYMCFMSHETFMNKSCLAHTKFQYPMRTRPRYLKKGTEQYPSTRSDRHYVYVNMKHVQFFLGISPWVSVRGHC